MLSFYKDQAHNDLQFPTTVHIFQQTLGGCGIINIGRGATLSNPYSLERLPTHVI